MITHTYLITYTVYGVVPQKITFAYKTANKGSLLAEELANIAIPENIQTDLKMPATSKFNIDMIFDCGKNPDE